MIFRPSNLPILGGTGIKVPQTIALWASKEGGLRSPSEIRAGGLFNGHYILPNNVGSAPIGDSLRHH